jgi:hypothetical protein
MELGLDGKVWAIGNRASADPIAFTYDFVNEDWDVANTALADASNNDVCRALTHSDSWEYAAFASGNIIKFDESGDTDYITPLTDLTGITICQNRLFALTEDDAGTNGVDITSYAVDADTSGGVTGSLQSVSVSTAIVAADTNLRQRMTSSPTGARFFVNYSDVSAVVYNCDSSSGDLVVTELARLPEGSKATSIHHTQGHTFITSQSLAETGQIPKTSLYVIDQANTVREVGKFRAQDPTNAPVVYMQSYETDLWLLQGKYVWRYDLRTGGLYLEFELDPGDQTYARSLAVTQGHVFAEFAQEDGTNTGGVVWVAGSVGTYRQASVEGGSSFTTSVYDYGLPGELKSLRSIQVLTDTLPADTSVTVEAQVNQDGTWLPIGTHSSGAEMTLTTATSETVLEFRTLQLRVSLVSATGVSTPVVKAVVVEGMVLGFEEFFELIVLTEDEDSSFHVSDFNRPGGTISQSVNALRRAGRPFTLVDAYEHAALDNNPEYLVVFDNSDGTNDEIGEGRMSVTLRVI